MGVRNCREIGENLQKIVSRLMANDNLVKLLYYNDADPYSKEALTEEQKRSLIFNKLIKIMPRVGSKETTQSIIAVKVDSGIRLSSNKEFRNVTVTIEVFVPWDQYVIKSTNLRPFAILGEIQESLEDKVVNGLGKITGGDFRLSYITDEIICYTQTFQIISYD